MEEIVRQYLSLATLDKQDPGARQKLIDTVLHTEDIQFQWSIITADIDSDIHVAQELSTRLINVDLHMLLRALNFINKNTRKLFKTKKH